MADRLWVVTAFFNPAPSRIRLQNYRRFRDRLVTQGGRLLTVELAFQGHPFQLQPTDAHRVIQVRADSILWQKERLLNIGLDHLPDGCDAVAWVDCDVLFVNDGWLRDAAQQLEQFPIVQPYELAVRLHARATTVNLATLPFGVQESEKDVGIGVRAAQGALQSTTRYDRMRWGHCGFAWCGRRELLQRHRFYDRAIVGSGDLCMAAAFLNLWRTLEMPTEAMRGDYHGWAAAVSHDVRGRIAYTPGAVLHCWHGARDHRFYAGRQHLLTRFAFDPAVDLRLNPDRCWEWSSPKRALHRSVRHYFLLRNEDGGARRLLRAVLAEPVFAGRGFLGAWRARVLGWVKRQLLNLHSSD